MGVPRFFPFRSVVRMSLLGVAVAAQAFAGPGVGYYPRFHGGYGFRGGYGYHGRFYDRAGWHRGPGWGWRPGFYRPALPVGCLTFRFGGAAWFFGGGFWYRPYGVGFVVAIPPPGIVIPVLPPDCVTFDYRGVPYYCSNDVYYTAAPGGQGYVVAAPPPGRAVPPDAPAGSPDEAALDVLVIIPKPGQSEAGILASRREAQRYASSQTGYDPARSDPADPGTPRARQRYLEVMKSYLQGRGYTVR